MENIFVLKLTFNLLVRRKCLVLLFLKDNQLKSSDCYSVADFFLSVACMLNVITVFY